ncbi:hypothetical protein [Stenotrophomonas acidaminiphila]
MGSVANDWLGRNPDIGVVAVKHDPVASFWYPPQLFIPVYYRQRDCGRRRIGHGIRRCHAACTIGPGPYPR